MNNDPADCYGDALTMPLAKMICICTIVAFAFGGQDCVAQRQNQPNAKPHAVEESIQSIQFSQPFGALPAEINLSESSSSATNMASSPKAVFWATNSNCFENLIFEEPRLERYGYSLGRHKQEVISATLFLTRAVALPFFRRGRQALCGR